MATPSLRLRVLQGAAVTLTLRAGRHETDVAKARQGVAFMERTLRLPRGVTETEESIAGIHVRRYSSGGSGPGVVLHLHGGSYFCGSSQMGRRYSTIAALGGPDMVSVDYRLAPEHPYPAGLEDALEVYRALLPAPVVLTGESAGGGLVLALAQRIRDDGLPMPVGVVPTFPWADLTQSGASYATARGHDMLTKEGSDDAAAMYAGDRDVRTPGVSPVFGSFANFPPTHITVGTFDSLLDDARSVAAALRDAGASLKVNEVEGAIHGFTTFPTVEARDAIQTIAYFVRDCLSRSTPPNI